ncbi:unnamed protein product [Ilex paraguariensis]|uniref:F-box/LRR-repeat protein 15/At3g58940/PEG3-like LRR domain-containing protein n=1 Tax=Ilex paraguariensis TaxID=185542 RepID=A0ABC8UXY7_9AQUA
MLSKDLTLFSLLRDIFLSYSGADRNGIKKLILDMGSMYEYKLPSSLFSCQLLSCLYITHCSVVTPHTFNGFGNLVSLQMQSCTVLNGVLENLISSCPILETLVLSDVDDFGLSDVGDFGYLNIYAPNLKSLHVDGKFMSVHLEHSLHLTELSLKMAKNWNMAHDSVSFLGFVSHLERLSLCGHLLRIKVETILVEFWPLFLFSRSSLCDHCPISDSSGVHYFDCKDKSNLFPAFITGSDFDFPVARLPYSGADM